MERYQKPSKFRSRFIKRLRWLKPGLGVKRWLLLILAGTTLIGVGFAILILDLYRNAPETWWLPALSYLSLRFLDRPMRAIIFGGAGISLILYGIWGLNRALLQPFMHPGKEVLETVSAYRRREKGPRIVVLGGGNGLGSMLRGLKSYSSNITAIVTVADDGGSSGEIRKNIGILPPGDIRNCLTALSDDETLLNQVFQYRFSSGVGLNGHTLGNLLITALTDITGSFEEAVAESGRVLAVKGRVLPATLHDVRLVAEVTTPGSDQISIVKGESQIPEKGGVIQRLWLEPSNPPAFSPSIQAILSADLIIIGPGSLYTSILPNLLVPDLAQAIEASKAVKFYICNVATQRGETDHFNCGDHIKKIEAYMKRGLFDLVICNQRFDFPLPQGVDWVKPEPDLEENYPVYFSDLVDADNPWRHDSRQLARVIMDLFLERTGPLVARED